MKANAGQLINQQQTVAKQQIAQTTAESHAFVNTNPQFADAQRKALDARVAAEHRATMTTMEEDHKRALNTVQTEYERGEITAKVARLRIAQEKLVAEQTIEQAKRTAIALSESSEQIVNKQAADARRRMNIEAGVANNTIAMHPQAPQPKGGVTQDQIGIYGTSYMMGHMLTITGLLSDALTTLGQRLTSVAQESAMTTGEFQRVSVSLESLTGSAERAKTFMKELQTYEAKVPATLPEMFDYARMLKGAGYATKDVIPVFNAVGNAAAGLGQGSAGIKRFMLALEGLRTGAPIGRELRAMAQDIYGSRPIEHIAKGLELSTATVRDKIKKGELTGKQIADALIRGLDADPAFKGAMEKMMDTLPGKLSTLESAVYKLKVAFGSVVSPDILRFMDKLIAGANLLVDKFEKMSPSAKHAIAMVVLIGGAALTASGHMMKFSGSMAYIIGELALFNMTLKSSGQSFASMIGGMAKASIPIMGIVAAIAMIGGALVLAYTQNKEFASQVNELWSTLKENILAIVYGIDMRFEEFGTTTLKVLGHAMENITEVISSACLGIAQLLEGFLDALTGNWGAAWEHMGSAVVNMFKGLLLGLPKLIGELGGIIGMAISGMFEKADQKAYQRLSSEVTTLQRRNIVISEQMRINTDRMKTANPDDKRTLIDTNQTLAQTRNDNNRRIRQLLAEMKEKNKNFAHDTAGDLRFMDTVFDFSSPKWSGNAWIPKKTKVGKDGPEPGANEHDDEAKEAAKAKENPLITMAKALAAANATEALQKKNPGLFPDFDVFTEKANIFKTAINAVIADATGDHDWFGSLSAGLDALNKKGKDLSIVDRAKLTADTAAVIKVYKDYEKAIADVDETERTLGRSSATLDTALKATFSAMRSLQKLGMTTGPQYASLSTQYDALLTETNTRIARDAQDKDLFDSQQKLYALQGEKARLDATPATTSTDAMERQRQVAEYQQKQGNLAIDMSQVVDAQKIKDKYRQKLIDEQANNKQIGDDRKKQIEE